MASLGLTVSGTIAGGITLNPVILGCISGPGILIQGYLTKSNIKTKRFVNLHIHHIKR